MPGASDERRSYSGGRNRRSRGLHHVRRRCLGQPVLVRRKRISREGNHRRITGAGTYTVGLEFNEEAQGLAFMAVGIVNDENTFGGYFIDVTDVKVNGESIAVGKGYTSSDNGIETRENIYNEWVGEIPADARRADGDLEGASPIIVDKEAFAAVKTVEITFNFIYGKPIEKDDAPMTQEEADALKQADFNAYIGVQGKDTYHEGRGEGPLRRLYRHFSHYPGPKSCVHEPHRNDGSDLHLCAA